MTALTDAVLMIVVVGAVLLALIVDSYALIAWLRRRSR
jgi:hypothetical protein